MVHKHHHKHHHKVHKHHGHHKLHHHDKHHHKVHKHHHKKPFKYTKFGHWLYRTGDNAKMVGKSLSKEAGNILHTGEHLIDNIGKTATNVSGGLESGLKVLSNPLILIGIGGIFLVSALR